MSQELVYGRAFDNSLKVLAKQSSGVDGILEYENIKEPWEAIKSQIANEVAERKALQAIDGAAKVADACEVDASMDVESLRAPPSAHSQSTPEYWQSVANQTVRTYITLFPEPKTAKALELALSQSSLKDCQAIPGSNSVVIWLDLDLLGESMGPSQQPRLRKQFNPEPKLIRKLLHGAMLARGAMEHKSCPGEATVPQEGDIVAIVCSSKAKLNDAKAALKPSTARSDAALDAEDKELLLTFHDESVRARKKLVRGSGNYSLKSTVLMVTSAPLIPACIPERQYKLFPCHNTSDVLGFIQACPPADLWHLGRTAGRIFVVFHRP